jgi:glycosyltransferase involved in cell wall biosynthesis
MKRIGIDARLYFQTGVGVYIRNLLYHLHRMKPRDWEIYVYFSHQDSHEAKHYPYFISRFTRARWHSFEEQYVFPRELYRDKLDIMHFTYFSYPILYRRPFVATVHDLTPLRHKTGKASTLPTPFYHFKHRLFRFVLAQQVKNATYILTPTQVVKEELVSIYKDISPAKIIPLHEGLNYEFQNESPKKVAIEGIGEAERFILYVGNFYPHKNVPHLITAFKMLRKTDIKLVLAGPSNYFSHALKCSLSDEDKKRIFLYHPTSSAELLFLYRNALGMVNPSLSEGFGLPLIEAATQGLPIAASDIPVFRELLGTQYIRFNPEDPLDISTALEQLFVQQSSRKKYSIPPDFSFEQMVKSYIEILSS